MRVFIAAIIAGLTLLTVGCSNDATQPTVAKINGPTVHANLMPSTNKTYTKVEGENDLEPECADGLEAVYIKANSTRNYIEVGSSGVVVKVEGNMQPNPGSVATFLFADAQDVRSAFVTLATSDWRDFQGLGMMPGGAYHYKAVWPEQGRTEAAAVTVDSQDFLKNSNRLVGLTICKG